MVLSVAKDVYRISTASSDSMSVAACGTDLVQNLSCFSRVVVESHFHLKYNLASLDQCDLSTVIKVRVIKVSSAPVDSKHL
jgi:hypothetical protein